MTFEISIRRKIRANRDFVFEWWTDLSPDDTKLVRPLKSRKIVLRTPEKIALRDEEEMYFRRMQFDVEVTLQKPDRWISEYCGTAGSARSEYTLKSESDGSTTLLYHTKIEPRGFLTRTFSPLVKPLVKRVFVSEMDIFIKTLENDFAQHKVMG